MRIYYHLSRYISHRQSGLEFIKCLRSLKHEVVTAEADIPSVDLAILHDDPMSYPDIFQKHPELYDKRTIAYAVWESTRLPNAFVEPLGLVDAIWTCSHFCKNAFDEHFHDVSVVPHVVTRISPSSEDIAFAREVTQAHDGAFLFLAVVDSINPRKNVTGLISLFSKARAALSLPVRLVLKQYRAFIDFSEIPGVVSLTEELSPGRMAALYAVTDAYLSPHHCEGWGLSLSTSMAYGKPVIATGYSGNMEYMSPENSFPIPYTLEPVSPLMCERLPLFTRDMEWARVDEGVFESSMRKVALGKTPPHLSERATEITRHFSRKAVSEIMQNLLER